MSSGFAAMVVCALAPRLCYVAKLCPRLPAFAGQSLAASKAENMRRPSAGLLTEAAQALLRKQVLMRVAWARIRLRVRESALYVTVYVPTPLCVFLCATISVIEDRLKLQLRHLGMVLFL